MRTNIAERPAPSVSPCRSTENGRTDVPPIQHEIERLEKAIASASQQLGFLLDRLSPVSTAMPPADTCTKEGEPAIGIPLAEKLCDLRRTMERFAETISEAHGRLGI